MTESFHLKGDFLYASAKKAADVFEKHQGTCWDFMSEALVLDGKQITSDFASEVPSDGFEGFDKPYLELSSVAKAGRFDLHWYHEEKSNTAGDRM